MSQSIHPNGFHSILEAVEEAGIALFPDDWETKKQVYKVEVETACIQALWGESMDSPSECIAYFIRRDEGKRIVFPSHLWGTQDGQNILNSQSSSPLGYYRKRIEGEEYRGTMYGGNIYEIITRKGDLATAVLAIRDGN